MLPPLFNISFPPLAFLHLYVGSIPIIWSFPKDTGQLQNVTLFCRFFFNSFIPHFYGVQQLRKKKKSKIKYKLQVDLLACLLLFPIIHDKK